MGPVGVLLSFLAVAASYLACLYGVELDQNSLAAFGFWSIAGIVVSYLVDLLFKFIFTLFVLFVAALIWTGNPAIEGPMAQAKALRGALCDKIPLDDLEVPIKEWIC